MIYHTEGCFNFNTLHFFYFDLIDYVLKFSSLFFFWIFLILQIVTQLILKQSCSSSYTNNIVKWKFMSTAFGHQDNNINNNNNNNIMLKSRLVWKTHYHVYINLYTYIYIHTWHVWAKLTWRNWYIWTISVSCCWQVDVWFKKYELVQN